MSNGNNKVENKVLRVWSGLKFNNYPGKAASTPRVQQVTT
jgi:hypothetical protein